MIGDTLDITPNHINSARVHIAPFLDDILNAIQPICLGVGGESGCGKTTFALALMQVLDSYNLNSVCLHMDDYFKLPPRTNHQKRIENIDNVSPHEVDLALLDAHVRQIKSKNTEILVKPLVDYESNAILKESVSITDVDVVLVEGTYCLKLSEIDIRIFIPHNYKQTRDRRVDRARDEISAFNELVLEIEHQIIKNHVLLADLVVDMDNNFGPN